VIAKQASGVFIFSPTGTLPMPLRDAVDQRLQITYVHDMAHWPPHTDYYCYLSKLSTTVERAAAVVGAQPVYLPKGSPYLAEQIWKRVGAGLPTYIFLATRVGQPAFIPYQAA
jgi:hypothetical protein